MYRTFQPHSKIAVPKNTLKKEILYKNQWRQRSIFDFYRTGKLQRPIDIPINVFIREVQFYEIQNEIIPEVRFIASH